MRSETIMIGSAPHGWLLYRSELRRELEMNQVALTFDIPAETTPSTAAALCICRLPPLPLRATVIGSCEIHRSVHSVVVYVPVTLRFSVIRVAVAVLCVESDIAMHRSVHSVVVLCAGYSTLQHHPGCSCCALRGDRYSFQTLFVSCSERT
jgi:hypothetical protein